MKQLTILCSSDLAGVVQEALIRSGAEGFLNLSGASGVMPGAAAPHGRPPRFEADMFLAPVSPDQAERVVRDLESYAGRCAVAPCLKILVSTLEAVY